MSRTGNRAQAARLRAREARLALMVERNAQDQRIEDAVAAALLAWEARAAAAAQIEDTERDVAAGLVSLSREKVPVRDMAAMTGIGEAVCTRLLKLPAAGEGSRDGPGSRRCEATGPCGATLGLMLIASWSRDRRPHRAASSQSLPAPDTRHVDDVEAAEDASNDRGRRAAESAALLRSGGRSWNDGVTGGGSRQHEPR